MFRTSKSTLARSTVVAGTLSLLLSSSALAGFHGTGSFARAPATDRATIHPSFDRGNMLRATSGHAPDRFGGARAVSRPPFSSNRIAGVASHPHENLPPAISIPKGTPSVGGNPAPSPGIAAYGVTVATPPAGKTAGQNGSVALGTMQTGAATGNAPIGEFGGLLQGYNGPGNIGKVQLGAGSSGNGQIGARGGLSPYHGPGAAPVGGPPTGTTTLRTLPGGQGPSQPGLGTTQTGSGSGTVFTIPPALWAMDQEEAKIKAEVQLANLMGQINAEINVIDATIQNYQTQLQQVMQSLADCPNTMCLQSQIDYWQQWEQQLMSMIQGLQTCKFDLADKAGLGVDPGVVGLGQRFLGSNHIRRPV
jgi:hypothetical protein